MTSATVDTSYEPFSREPEYIEGNREFLRALPLEAVRRVVDLACGTGAITESMLEMWPEMAVIGVDLSRESLTLGRQDFLAHGFSVHDDFLLSRETPAGRSDLILIEGTADSVPVRSGWADLVFMGHSIHMLPDFDRLLDEIHRVLAPGGLFAFNSSFYAGSQAPGTDGFYHLWWKHALGYVTARGIARKRGTATRAKPWTSKEEWFALLEKHGFALDAVNERTIVMSPSSVRTIGAYSGLARLMLSGYPVELASEALVESVDPALREAGLTEVPRLWLEISARKK